jgi:transketolase
VPIIKGEDGVPFYGLNYTFDYGKEDILRVGNMGSIFVTGTPVGKAVKAVDKLREQGIYLQLIYVSCPLAIDRETLETAARNKIVFSIEDHNVNSGLGAILADRIGEENLCCRLVKIGIPEYPRSGSSEDLYNWAGLSSQSIIDRITEELQS